MGEDAGDARQGARRLAERLTPDPQPARDPDALDDPPLPVVDGNTVEDSMLVAEGAGEPGR